MSELVVTPVDPGAVSIPQLSAADLDVLRGLVAQWAAKSRRNVLRQRYYDGKNRLSAMGFSIPPQFKTVETVVGWPAKGVDGLGHRIVWDGYVLPGDQEDPFGLVSVFADNHMDVELPQAITSALIHSVSFLSVTNGDVASGEPEVLVQARSALHGTGVWDRRRRGMSAFLSIAAVADTGMPTEMVLHQPDKVSYITRLSPGQWRVDVRRNPAGRVLVEPLIYRPDLSRPFGRSRITRAVMSITDEAVRTVLRTEVSAEFYTSPQRYALGIDAEAFGSSGPGWEAILGRLFTVSKDEDGDVPTVGEFRQMSMQPHTEMLRSIASRFAAETSLPLSSLGIVQDNPASAEAIFAAKEDLVIEAQNAGKTFGAGLVRVGQNIVLLRDGLDRVPDELRRLQASWVNPATPSVVSAADAVVKQVAAVPWLAESPLILSRLGYTQAEIVQLLSDKRRGQGRAVLEALTAAAQPSAAPVPAGEPVTGGDEL